MNISFKDWVNTEEILGDDSLCMYFTFGDSEVFGSPEESRLVFAKIKDPKDEDRDALKDAMFSGIDLMKISDKIINQGISECIKNDVHYKDIYPLLKARTEALGISLGRSPLKLLNSLKEFE